MDADAEDELSELEPSKAYIIGGIVDRNRYKGLCRTKAESDGIKTARLPIGDYVKLHAAPVMTVNQVMRPSFSGYALHIPCDFRGYLAWTLHLSQHRQDSCMPCHGLHGVSGKSQCQEFAASKDCSDSETVHHCMQCVAILVNYLERQDWQAAFEATVPQRKRAAGPEDNGDLTHRPRRDWR